MIAAETLLVPLLNAFLWFDDGLQSYLQAQGWNQVTRSQSMVMANVAVGVRKPSDIARNLGISRQSVHATVMQMVKLGMFELTDDAEDGRAWVVTLSEKGEAMRRDANDAVAAMTAELRERIGSRNVDNLIKAFRENWGAAPVDWSGRAPKRG